MTRHHHSLQTSMISMIIAIVLFLAFPGIGNSQVVGKGYNNSLIYKVQSDTNTVYIVGSIHQLAEDFYPLTRAFSYAYYDSQKIVMEVDPRIMASAKGKKYVNDVATFSNGMTLKKALTSKTYSLLKKNLKRLEIDIHDIQELKPWKIYLQGGTGDNKTAKDFRTHLGVESFFIKWQMTREN